MSTKWCHQCGSEFVARVETCPDCQIALSFDPPGPGPDAATSVDGKDRPGEPGPGDHVIYPLHEWSEEARYHLDRLLQSGWLPGPGSRNSIFNARERVQDTGVGAAVTGKTRPGILHAWQGTDLVVPFEEQERAEAFIDQVELAVVVALDVEAPKVAYDLSDLTDGQLDEISESLLAGGHPHGFDEETGELVIHEADEDEVEAILDAVDFPDALPVDEDGDEPDDDPLAASQAMSDLFVASDRLRKNARDPDGVLGSAAAAEVVGRLAAPYGFSDADWQTIADRAAALVALLDGDDTADEAIEEAADLLRSLLRQYV